MLYYIYSALHLMAKSVIIAPGWNEEPNNPITLVHGNYYITYLKKFNEYITILIFFIL